jgi:type I restriction enzyme R subunit
VDISGVMSDVEDLLDRSVAAEPYVIKEPSAPVYLTGLDLEDLREQFASGRKRIAAEKLRALIQGKATRLARLNRTRMDYLEALQRLIEEYNSGSINAEAYFERLIELAQDLNEEEKRGIAEQLTEEELALFDLLTRPGPGLTDREVEQVKTVARDLLDTLKAERLVLDWRKRQQSRAAVRQEIEIYLDQLPQAYDKVLYDQKCEAVYQHVYDTYFGPGHSIYAVAGQ